MNGGSAAFPFQAAAETPWGKGIDQRTLIATIMMHALVTKLTAPASERAQEAVRHADALIEELNKPQPQQPTQSNG